MQLVCYMDGRRGQLYNGGWYTVVSVDHSKFRLKGEDEVRVRNHRPGWDDKTTIDKRPDIRMRAGINSPGNCTTT